MKRTNHILDQFSWCERCGESMLRIVEYDLVCEPPDASTLAHRRLSAVVARAPLMMVVDKVMGRLEDSGVIP